MRRTNVNSPMLVSNTCHWQLWWDSEGLCVTINQCYQLYLWRQVPFAGNPKHISSIKRPTTRLHPHNIERTKKKKQTNSFLGQINPDCFRSAGELAGIFIDVNSIWISKQQFLCVSFFFLSFSYTSRVNKIDIQSSNVPWSRTCRSW